jgi:hypothetical protein
LNDEPRVLIDLVSVEAQPVLIEFLGHRKVLLILEVQRYLLVALDDGCDDEVAKQAVRPSDEHHQNEFTVTVNVVVDKFEGLGIIRRMVEIEDLKQILPT